MVIAIHIEDLASHIPAIQLLMNLGFQYLTASETATLRDDKRGKVILESILEDWLAKNNSIKTLNGDIPFSHENIKEAILSISDISVKSLQSDKERILDFLSKGKSLEQNIDGSSGCYFLHYINWKEPHKNVFHVTDVFEVESRLSHKMIQSDIVLFVNGIPFVVIACKKPTLNEEAVNEGVNQCLNNQKEIPSLYCYSQLLLILAQNKAKYGTTGAPVKIWEARKVESGSAELTELSTIINKPLSEADKIKILSKREPLVRSEMERLLDLGNRLPTTQDQIIYSILRPDRLIEHICNSFSLETDKI